MSVSPPRPKGPPLNALRAFEAAARLGGFANAAEELCVTPGAISQHIRALEAWIGADLFERRSQGVRLTALGAEALPGFATAFDAMGAAVYGLRSAARHGALHIAALPSVAQLWLSPRLPVVRAALPSLHISVSAIENPPNLARDLFDLSLFIRPPTGARGEQVLAQDMILPVCAPEMAAGLRSPADLMGQTLLHDALWSEDWALWARARLPGISLPTTGPRYSLYAIALEEARHGAGVLMGHQSLVQSALDDGSLVAPFDLAVATGKALVLEHPAFDPPRADLARVLALLGGQVTG
ncbi:glycine cleavage system transcriptional activator [Roseovarius mucosus]|uniref:Glycine cleavage system transcriptional activator n=1 Tax=Roseovarius mucosus TaxID=215743 RepID=A0A1V0RLJ6_9RHOB|nr:LysR family transcriptional regulator [Roseovarius mucosus]ARE82663.1 glycine cleavage system transcriptional activator [Roseovarius mucosus]